MDPNLHLKPVSPAPTTSTVRTYHLGEVARRDSNIRPQLPALHKPNVWWKSLIAEPHVMTQMHGTYRSYAVDVLKEMTRPSTVPSTVNIWLEMAREVEVKRDTSVTTKPRAPSHVNGHITSDS